VRPAPRLVATDLDGTLLRSDGTLSARSAAALAELDRRGVPVVFVTGRPLRWMEVVRAHVGAHGLAICANGAVVLELPTDAVTLLRPIPTEVARAAAHDIRAAMPSVRFAVETDDGMALEPGYPSVAAPPDGSQVEAVDRLVERTVVKLLVRHPTLGPDAFLEAVLPLVAGRATATQSGPAAMVEISAEGVTKASTLALLCDRFGVAAADVVAFGDMPNDLPMLTWAGRSFAVGSAHPAVLAAASDRAAGNDEDGVARVLESLFGL
jgi:HAD superfamily hydrolase (TIGR01484 family)